MERISIQEVTDRLRALIAATNGRIDALSLNQGDWLGEDFDTFAELAAFNANRPAGFETIPDKTWCSVMADESHDGYFSYYAWFNNQVRFRVALHIEVRDFTEDPIKESELAQALKDKIGGKVDRFSAAGGKDCRIVNENGSFAVMAMGPDVKGACMAVGDVKEDGHFGWALQSFSLDYDSALFMRDGKVYILNSFSTGAPQPANEVLVRGDVPGMASEIMVDWED